MNLPQDNEGLREVIVKIWYSAYHAGMGVHNGRGDDGKELEEVDAILALFQAEQTRLKAEARLVELDLLEQFINNNEYKERFITVLKQFKMHRRSELTAALDRLEHE